MLSVIILYYNIMILCDHRRIRDPSLTETSLCGAYPYLDSDWKINDSALTVVKYFLI